MAKKIAVSLRDGLYDWASREIQEGRAESVSALIAEGLEILKARTGLESLVAALAVEAGELGQEIERRVEDALRASEEAYRKHLAGKTGQDA
ncbi:MAG TPA: hypothetical protein VGP70_19900 [Actinomadura sp.]|jgi:Arc/MetJ-type ribon-helix-helix transcriptional regulator|nr:hypothetical protein [Actinomadura sp.]